MCYVYLFSGCLQGREGKHLVLKLKTLRVKLSLLAVRAVLLGSELHPLTQRLRQRLRSLPPSQLMMSRSQRCPRPSKQRLFFVFYLKHIQVVTNVIEGDSSPILSALNPKPIGGLFDEEYNSQESDKLISTMDATPVSGECFVLKFVCRNSLQGRRRTREI